MDLVSNPFTGWFAGLKPSLLIKMILLMLHVYPLVCRGSFCLPALAVHPDDETCRQKAPDFFSVLNLESVWLCAAKPCHNVATTSCKQWLLQTDAEKNWTVFSHLKKNIKTALKVLLGGQYCSHFALARVPQIHCTVQSGYGALTPIGNHVLVKQI